ncbi:hypothetical protein AMPC_13170 [Anaeromyxobacter paludicola]|uniref:Uncharacterized protein n=2 Tax=Anaeromyxobacter paludicola TaxID=2918171 RepID=A0ABN6N844_9BACT|nr:hypothetical protein [Anaeromyxobacter paludicola]BDG08204.1 hypothetical protein AMPC_13170 [Anaeromyxobacter paludicola]
MDPAVECTWCGVAMTAFTAPGRSVRCWQCPHCRRTFSSARAPAPAATAEVRWPQLKDRAARWFERLEREGRTAPAAPRRLSAEAVAAVAARGR